jgi:hypothetical protein
MAEMTVEDIVHGWLNEHGYGGLYSDSGGCGCELDDLWPCGYHFNDCKPGYKVQCDGTCDDPPCGFHIVADDPIGGE